MWQDIKILRIRKLRYHEISSLESSALLLSDAALDERDPQQLVL